MTELIKKKCECTECGKLVAPHIIEYPSDIFVAFDPQTDGCYINGAARTLEEAIEIRDRYL